MLSGPVWCDAAFVLRVSQDRFGPTRKGNRGIEKKKELALGLGFSGGLYITNNGSVLANLATRPIEQAIPRSTRHDTGKENYHINPAPLPLWFSIMA